MISENKLIPLNRIPLLVSIGWIITYALLPFGSITLGFVALLFLQLGYFIKDFITKKENSDTAPAHNYQMPPITIWTNWLFLCLWGIMLISSLFSYKPEVSSLFAIGAGLLIFISVFGGQRLARSNGLLSGPYIPILAIGSIIASLLGVAGYYYYHLDRARNIFCDANGFGTVLIVVAGYTIGYLLSKDKKHSYLVFPYFLLIIPALILTQTRAAWLGFFTLLGFFSLFRKKFFIIFLIIILILGTIFWTFPPLRERLSSSFSVDQNMNRVYIWQSTIRMIHDHPLFGVGAGLYQSLFNKYAMPGSTERNMVWSHNLFLEFLVEFGPLTLIVFIIILLFTLYMGFLLIRTGKPLYLGIVGSFIGVLLQSQFDLPMWRFDLGGVALWLYFGLIIGFYQYEFAMSRNNQK